MSEPQLPAKAGKVIGVQLAGDLVLVACEHGVWILDENEWRELTMDDVAGDTHHEGTWG